METKRQNVLLLIFDDLAPLLGCYGDPIAKTPHIDRLAARGTVFDQAYTPCAICSPGRACLFTGLRPDTHGVTRLGHKLRGRIPDVITWPQALRARGWYTSGAGKVYHKGVPDGVSVPGGPEQNFGCGDVFSWDRFRSPGGMELNCNGVMRNYTAWETHTAGIGGAISWLRAEKGDHIHQDARVAREICNEIRCHDPESGPAFWAAGFVRPHVPLVAPKRFFEMYDDVDIPLPDERSDATPLADPVANQWCSNFNLSPEQRQEAIRAYYACISFVDEQIGHLLDALEQYDYADDTVVMLTGDHGFQLGEHGLWFKNFLYRESVRIPLIIADPRLPESHGRTSHALVEQPDVFPTLFELLGLALPRQQDFEGISLVPLLCGEHDHVRRALEHQVDWGDIQGRCVRTHEWAYVRWSGEHEQEQLFNLADDPGEEVDLLAGGGNHPMAATLAQWLSDGAVSHLSV